MLRNTGARNKLRLTRYVADPAVCNACPLKNRCTEGKSGRAVNRNFDEEYFERVKGYYGLEAYKKAMRKRRVWIEPMFAKAKQWHGMERTRLRMLEKANCEALITASGQNVKRLLTFGGRGPRRPAQEAALRPPGRPLIYLGRRGHRARRWSFTRRRGVFQQAVGKLYVRERAGVPGQQRGVRAKKPVGRTCGGGPPSASRRRLDRVVVRATSLSALTGGCRFGPPQRRREAPATKLLLRTHPRRGIP